MLFILQNNLLVQEMFLGSLKGPPATEHSPGQHNHHITKTEKYSTKLCNTMVKRVCRSIYRLKGILVGR